MDEFALIERLLAPLAAGHAGSFGLGNDGAVLEPVAGRDIVLSKDMLAAGVHFPAADERHAFPPGEVARRVLRANLSDLAAMGARPRGYLLGLGLTGACDEAWLEAFCAGLRIDQAEFGIALLGGDTIRTPGGAATFSLTALGDVAAGRALVRSGAEPGHVLALSGTVGDAVLGRRALEGSLPEIDGEDRAVLAERFRLPRPRLALGVALVGLASAALDVSDGLLADAGHIARRSGVGLVLRWTSLPLSPAARRAVTRRPRLRLDVVSGGDDYELLFTVAPEHWRAVLETAAACGTPVTRVGVCVEAGGVVMLDAEGLEIAPPAAGWRHRIGP